MKRVIPIAVAVVLVVICAVGQGLSTQRWTGGTSATMQAMAERFDEIKAKPAIGDWEKTSESELPEEEVKAAGAKNYLTAVYTNRATRQQVSVFLICGFGRNVAVHTPETCFVGAGMNKQDEARDFDVEYKDKYALDENPDDDTVPTGTMKFRTARFTRESTDQDQQTFWAWHSFSEEKEDWLAPQYPRVHYGGGTPLTKIYITVSNKETDLSPGLVAREFATAFLTEVSEILGAPIEEAELEEPAAG